MARSAAARLNVHIIAEIKFVPRQNDGPVTCSCGVQMLASQFADHRKAVRADIGTQISDLDVQRTVWKRSVST